MLSIPEAINLRMGYPMYVGGDRVTIGTAKERQGGGYQNFWEHALLLPEFYFIVS